MSTAARGSAGQSAMSPVRVIAVVVSVAFLLVGVLGFVPGVTTNVGDLMFAGHHSGAMLLGLFSVSVLHNIIHLAFGVVGLVLARTVRGGVWYLIAGGVVYLVVWLYGVVIDQSSAVNFIPINTADNWLHLGLGVVMVALGLVFARSIRAAR